MLCTWITPYRPIDTFFFNVFNNENFALSKITIPTFTSQSYSGDSTYNNKAFNLPAAQFDSDVNSDIDDLRSDGGYKWVSVTYNGKTFAVNQYTTLSYTFSDFANTLSNDEFSFVVYNFAYEQYARPICLMTGLENWVPTYATATNAFIDACVNSAMAILPIKGGDTFDLDVLIGFGALPNPQARIDAANAIGNLMKEEIEHA